jgi:hypothetical protein
MSDLFGNPDPLPASTKAPAVAVSLFDAAAEKIAYEGGRNVAQVRIELQGHTGRPVIFAREAQTCKRCGATFHAAPRADATCNLCRRANA